MFGIPFEILRTSREQAAAAERARRMVMQDMLEHQAKAHREMVDAGAKMVIIRPDGTIVPIYD